MPVTISNRFLIILILLEPGMIQANSLQFNRASGDWNEAENWSPQSVPTSSDDVRIGSATPAGQVASISSGTAHSYSSFIGLNAGITGSLTVSGMGSQWINGSLIVGGFNGNGSLTVQGGGQVKNGYGEVGLGAGSQGTVTVSGAGSFWDTGVLYVGAGGKGRLTIEDGGRVLSQLNGYLGVGDSGEVTVRGAGSFWDAGFYLIMGYTGEGSGKVTVDEGAKIRVNLTSLVPDMSGTRGDFYLKGDQDRGRGILETGIVRKGVGNGTLHLDGGILKASRGESDFLQNFLPGDALIYNGGALIETDYPINISTNLQNASGQTGGLTKLGTGVLALTGNSTYSGPTVISAGTIIIQGSIEGTVIIENGATLKGSGTVGMVTVGGGGTIAPGLSPGTLLTGSQTWWEGGKYQMEIEAETGIAGIAWDLIRVDGSLTIEATPENPFTVELSSLGEAGLLADFDPAVDHQWEILTVRDAVNGFDPLSISVNGNGFLNNVQTGAFSVIHSGNSLYLKFSSVPEPGIQMLACVGSFVFLISRRSRIKR